MSTCLQTALRTVFGFHSFHTVG